MKAVRWEFCLLLALLGMLASCAAAEERVPQEYFDAGLDDVGLMLDKYERWTPGLLVPQSLLDQRVKLRSDLRADSEKWTKKKTRTRTDLPPEKWTV